MTLLHGEPSQGKQATVSLPNDVRMTGLILDRDNADAVDVLHEVVPNADARKLLQAWKRSRYPFLLVAGHLHRFDGATVGGVAADWSNAARLFDIVSDRFNAMAQASGVAFSTVWQLHLTAKNSEQATAMIAAAQQTAGEA